MTKNCHNFKKPGKKAHLCLGAYMRAKLKVWPPSGTTNILKLQICWVLSQDESPEVTPVYHN